MPTSSNKIAGRYIVQTKRSFASYELTGNSRTASVNVTPSYMDWILLSDAYIDNLSTNKIAFQTKNSVHVKRLRIITPGGEGLRTTQTAAVINLSFNDFSSGVKIAEGPIFEVPKFGEWLDLDTYIEPWKFVKASLFAFGISAGSLSIDDFNIQDKYIGESVEFTIQLDLKTAGLSRNGKIV